MPVPCNVLVAYVAEGLSIPSMRAARTGRTASENRVLTRRMLKSAMSREIMSGVSAENWKGDIDPQLPGSRDAVEVELYGITINNGFAMSLKCFNCLSKKHNQR